MGIDFRDSKDVLSKDVILGKITEYDIFRYYCPNFVLVDKKFLSDLRQDKRPSVVITVYNSRLLYKDFGHTGHTFDCFTYIQYKYSCNFIESLRIIDNDFRAKF